MIYFGETVTVQVEGQTWRSERCEHCGQQFYYPVCLVATGAAANPYFLDSNSARRAQDDAVDRLEHALQHHLVLVTCPHCTLYQNSMLPTVRAEQFPRMRTASQVLLTSASLMLTFGCLLSGALFDTIGFAAAVVGFGLSALLLCAGIGLFLTRYRRQARYDPNAPEHVEERRRAVVAIGLKPEEFARLQIPPPATGALRRRGQLVGQNCVRCGGRISNELDNRFCERCGSPVHNRCATPTEGGCPLCGASGG